MDRSSEWHKHHGRVRRPSGFKVTSQTTIIQRKVTWSIHKHIQEIHTLRHLKTGILEQARETGWRKDRDRSHRCNVTFTAAPADSVVGKELCSNPRMAAQRAGRAEGAFWTGWLVLTVAKPSDKGRDAAHPLSGREQSPQMLIPASLPFLTPIMAGGTPRSREQLTASGYRRQCQELTGP